MLYHECLKHQCITLPLHTQDKADASLLKLVEMLDQKNVFEEQLAQSARSASDQRMSFDNQMAKAAMDATDQQTSFDSQMAKAAMDASDQQAQVGSMQTAYDKLSCENVEQQRAAAQVRIDANKGIGRPMFDMHDT